MPRMIEAAYPSLISGTRTPTMKPRLRLNDRAKVRALLQSPRVLYLAQCFHRALKHSSFQFS